MNLRSRMQPQQPPADHARMRVALVSLLVGFDGGGLEVEPLSVFLKALLGCSVCHDRCSSKPREICQAGKALARKERFC